jgi:hypothetical protein
MECNQKNLFNETEKDFVGLGLLIFFKPQIKFPKILETQISPKAFFNKILSNRDNLFFF